MLIKFFKNNIFINLLLWWDFIRRYKKNSQLKLKKRSKVRVPQFYFSITRTSTWNLFRDLLSLIEYGTRAESEELIRVQSSGKRFKWLSSALSLSRYHVDQREIVRKKTKRFERREANARVRTELALSRLRLQTSRNTLICINREDTKRRTRRSLYLPPLRESASCAFYFSDNFIFIVF